MKLIALKLFHTKLVVTLVAFKFLLAWIPGHYLKLALRPAFGAFTIDSFSSQVVNIHHTVY
jgi:hypothetical protein